MTAEPLLLSNARVLDVAAGRYHDGRFVSIANGRIAAISDAKPGDAGREIDVGSRGLMPGSRNGRLCRRIDGDLTEGRVRRLKTEVRGRLTRRLRKGCGR